MKLYTGVVENRYDPLRLGRCQVRVVGLHTEQKSVLPTEDLPWAYPLQPITSAAMNGIGHSPVGPVEGTWVIVFFRDDDQQQPIILGTVGGIPQNDAKKLDEFTDFVELFPSSISSSGVRSQDTTTPITTAQTGQPLTETAQPAEAAASEAAPTRKDGSEIPGTDFGPRPGSSVSIPQSSHRGIIALGNAMTAAGITSAYARAAILGIAMGESKCVPQLEGYKYSRNRIKQVFSWLTDAEADQYAGWTGTREDFFRFIYSPSTRSGRNLGNSQPDDGANFFGRGYIQLTGRPNYERYKQKSGVDIITNPDLCNDYDQGATVAVSYFLDRVKVSQDDPSYFEAACRAVGYNVPDIKAAKKAYYEYFLGEASLDSKSAVPGQQPANVEVNAQGIPKDRAHQIDTGFSDPDMKYPLRSHINEPDTNRLARSKTEGTAVQIKDATRAIGMPVADGTEFSQPPIPYNAKYPFNHVYESESGHLMEFDDTPENERIHWYHKAGTYTEVDVNGTQVNRIVGNGYEIIDKNGYVYVKGAYSITAEGTTNIFVNADCNLKVAGLAKMDFGKDVELNIAGKFDINVGKGVEWKAQGMRFQTTGEKGDDGDLGAISITSNTALNLNTTAPISFKTSDAIYMQSEGDFNIKSGAVGKIQTGGLLSLKAGGSIGADAGGIIDLANGASTDADDALETPTTGIGDPIEEGTPQNNSFPEMETPTRNFEEESNYETPEEVSTPQGRAATVTRDSQIIGEKSTPQNTTAEESSIAAIPPAVSAGADCSLIMGMDQFPRSFKLSQNVNLGMLITNSSHILQSQMARGKMTSKQEIVCNLKGLADACIEPIGQAAGGIENLIITSGFRGNTNGRSNSQHCAGQAFDFQLRGKINDYQAHYDFVQRISGLVPFDQLILEYRDPGVNGNNRNVRICWIHCSFVYTGQRKHAFTMLNDSTYAQGFSLIT